MTNVTAQVAADDAESWEELYAIPTWLQVILVAVYASVSLCAVIGNWMIFWIVIRSNLKKTVTNLFIANLAVADIVIGAFAIPFQFQAALLQKWLLPHFMCSFCPTVQVVSLNLSIFTLVTLSIDRHRAVTRPLSPRMSKRTAILIILFIWVISVLTAIPTFLAYEVHQRLDDGNDLVDFCAPFGVSETFFRVYNHFMVSIQYVIPLVVITVVYIQMAVVLSSGPGIRNDSVEDSRRVSQSKKRVIKMLLIVISIFAICWLPFQSYNILSEIYPDINRFRYINVIWFACHLFAMSNSCYNPFIYVLYGEHFNQQLKAKFPICCFWAPQIRPSATSTTTTSRIVLSTCPTLAIPQRNGQDNLESHSLTEGTSIYRVKNSRKIHGQRSRRQTSPSSST